VRQYNLDIPLDLDSKYIGTTASIAVIESGAIFLVTIGDQAAGNNYLLVGTTQLLFTDL